MIGRNSWKCIAIYFRFTLLWFSLKKMNSYRLNLWWRWLEKKSNSQWRHLCSLNYFHFVWFSGKDLNGNRILHALILSVRIGVILIFFFYILAKIWWFDTRVIPFWIFLKIWWVSVWLKLLTWSVHWFHLRLIMWGIISYHSFQESNYFVLYWFYKTHHSFIFSDSGKTE